MQSILEKDGSVLSTAIDFFNVVSNKASNSEKSEKKDTYLGGSISKYTKDLIMTFPMMFDTSLSPATAGIMSKANERNIVTMLELLFGSMQINASTGKAAIQQVHKNINSAMGLDDIFNAIDDALGESFKFFTQQSGVNIEGIRTVDVLREMTDYLKYNKQKSYPINSFRETSLNDYLVIKDYYGKTVVREAKGSNNKPTVTNNRDINKDKITDSDQKELERLGVKNVKELNEKGLNPYKKGSENYYAWEKENRENSRESRDAQRARREEQLSSLPRVMTDQDYRKANELAPTLMIITFNELGEDGKVVGKTSFAAGVKSRMIPVESNDIIERLVAKKNTALNFVNLIRATTGEISFTKDFLFAISQSKILAKNAAKKGPVAKMWNVLDARHTKNNKNAIRRDGNDASAITTLVVNQETANMIKKEYNFDIENAKNARYIMEEYNLLALFICDESVEVTKIFYHGNDGFENISYASLDRENDSAKAYKDVINLVNKTGR